MGKRICSLVLALTMIFTCFMSIQVKAEENADLNVKSVKAPNKNLKINFWLDSNGAPYYNIDFNGEVLIEDSSLGLQTTIGDFKDGLKIIDTSNSSDNETWSPVVGEKETIADCYNQTAIKLQHTNGTEFSIELRAYDTGVSFRYVLPEKEEDYTIKSEYTRFTFPDGATAYAHVSGNQTLPTKLNVNNFNASHTYQRPMTIGYSNGVAMTVTESNLDNYGVMTLKKDSKERTLKTEYATYSGKGPNVVVKGKSPSVSPWRTFVVASNLAELPNNSDIILNLNEAPDEETYKFSEWVEPGNIIRAMTLNTEAVKTTVDQAKESGVKYVLLDTGWYGPENDANCDPRLDPSLLDPENPTDKLLLDNYFGRPGEGMLGTGEGVFNTRGKGFSKYGKLGTPGDMHVDVDIPAICNYANENGVGIILYVNRECLPDSSGRNRYGAEEIFAKFESWGVKGVKPGFVNARAQQYEAYMQEVIEAAARHKLVMTIHDEYVITGTQRTFPNLLTVEGVLGDEGVKSNQIAGDIGAIFTRAIQGPVDHCYIYPSSSNSGKGTKVYQLASPILFNSGAHCLYWYTNPTQVPEQDKGRMKIWENMPNNWKESKYLEASMYEYATYARKSFDDEWYLGSLSAIERDLNIPLTFLDEGVKYVADIYADGENADPYASATVKANQILENNKFIVDSTTVLNRSLKYGFGYAVKFTKATTEDMENMPEYNTILERLMTKVEIIKMLDSKDFMTDIWNELMKLKAEAELILSSPENYTNEQIEMIISEIEAVLNIEDIIKDIIKDIKVDGEKLGGFDFRKTEYYYPVKDDIVPVVTATIDESKATLKITNAERVPGEAKVEVAIKDGINLEYTIIFRNVKQVEYLSDMEFESCTFHYGDVLKDISVSNNPMSVTKADGLSEWNFAKGVGAHANDLTDSTIIYDIEGKGYDEFQTYVGISYHVPVNNQSSVQYKIYVDDEATPRYVSGVMGRRTPAEFVSVDVRGAKKIKLLLDPIGGKNYDHANFADAKFIAYEEISDKTLLLDLYNRLKDKENDNYTEESWNNFKYALELAAKVIDDVYSSQEEVDEAYDNLANAEGSLEYSIFKKILEEVVESAEKALSSEKNNKPAPVRRLEDLIIEANIIIEDNETTQEAVNLMVTELLKAINKVLDKGDDVSTEIILDLAKNLSKYEDKYTVESWSDIKNAYDVLQELTESDGVAKNKIKKAHDKLEKAINNLVFIE